MTPTEQEAFIREVYKEIFEADKVELIGKYFADDFVEENNYDILTYKDFVAHVEDISGGPSVSIDLEFIVNVPGQVVVRAIVNETGQIKGAPPMSLLISYWEINKEGKLSYCKEVEAATAE